MVDVRQMKSMEFVFHVVEICSEVDRKYVILDLKICLRAEPATMAKLTCVFLAR